MHKGKHAAVRHDSHGNVSVGIDDVVKLMAMKSPNTGIRGYKLYIPGGPRWHTDSIARPLGRRRDRPPLGTHYLPRMTMNMDRMAAHGQVAEADPNPITLLYGHDLNIRGYLSIKREPVEIHGDKVGSIIARSQCESLEHDGKVPMDFSPGPPGMDNKKSPQAHSILLHHVEAGVVHEGPDLM